MQVGLMVCMPVSYTHLDVYKRQSLREFATEETVYPASFDTITGKIGFERVEIDLSTKGRIPPSKMKLQKAKKTVIECSFFDSPMIIDSVCSWVNICLLYTSRCV